MRECEFKYSLLFCHAVASAGLEMCRALTLVILAYWLREVFRAAIMHWRGCTVMKTMRTISGLVVSARTRPPTIDARAGTPMDSAFQPFHANARRIEVRARILCCEDVFWEPWESGGQHRANPGMYRRRHAGVEVRVGGKRGCMRGARFNAKAGCVMARTPQFPRRCSLRLGWTRGAASFQIGARNGLSGRSGIHPCRNLIG